MDGKIYAAMAAIMKETDAIGKDQKNQAQKFNYRGIDGFPKYVVSDSGDVYSCQSGEWRKLSPLNTPNGYLHVVLCEKGVQKRIGVHQLVAQCFIQNPDGHKQVNHKNGIKKDNRKENLEWASQSENVKHAYGLELRTINEEHRERARLLGESKRKLTIEQADEIRALFSTGMFTKTSLSKRFGVNRKSIQQIIDGTTYRGGVV